MHCLYNSQILTYSQVAYKQSQSLVVRLSFVLVISCKISPQLCDHRVRWVWLADFRKTQKVSHTHKQRRFSSAEGVGGGKPLNLYWYSDIWCLMNNGFKQQQQQWHVSYYHLKCLYVEFKHICTVISCTGLHVSINHPIVYFYTNNRK